MNLFYVINYQLPNFLMRQELKGPVNFSPLMDL